MSERKSKTFYIDTNVALDYITGRNREAMTVLNKIKDRGWKCISSSFFAMELADYRKESLFVIEKAMEKKWEMRKIMRELHHKDLRRGDFDKVLNWFDEFRKDYNNIELFDFLNNNDDWQRAQAISFESNLNAPDAIHLASAMKAAIGGWCQILVTQDQHFLKEAQRILKEQKLIGKLRLMTVSDVRKNFFSKEF